MPYSFFLDFSGGHNDTNSIVKVAPNEGEFYNLNLERDGSFSKRKGSIKQNSVATGATDECGMIFQFKPSATTAKFLVQFGSALKLWDGSAFTDLLTGLTANKVMLPAPFKNLCYFNNNADVPLVYYPDASSGPTVFRAGCPAPTSSPTQGADVAGSLTAGDKFKVRVRYVSKIDGNFMGEPYPEAGVEITVGASGGRTIDNIPVYTPSGIDYEIADRIFERTTAGATPGGTFYEDQRLGDNTTTSADVTQSDTLLLENAIMPDLGARGIPPKLWPFTVYKNRVCGFDPTDFGRFVYSEIDEFGILPEAFPSLNYQYIDVQDFEDAPTAVAVMGEFLVVYCGRSIHLIHIDEAGVSSSRKILTHELGIPNPRAIAVLPSGHLIWTYRGPYLFDLTNLIFIGERIETSIDTIPKSDLDKLYTVVLPQEKRRQVKFCFPSSGSKPDKAAVYHYRRPSLNPDGFPTEHAWTFFDGFESKSGAIVINASTKVFEVVFRVLCTVFSTVRTLAIPTPMMPGDRLTGNFIVLGWTCRIRIRSSISPIYGCWSRIPAG